ncbi:hypothetical protein DL769_007454 [Monosporascus sp. CRB-8-3]|nr:hypothetical protein DL769_007454 [Monosporascus sp. CRB-8-3]
MRLENVILPSRGPTTAWDITVKDGLVRTIQASQPAADHIKSNNAPSLLLPTLCHPHVHLDKPYILTGNHAPCSPAQPSYFDLTPRTGSFGEALTNTSKAKERYTEQDLYLRGSQLLATSYGQGVTSLRAFVELDHVTGNMPLVTAMRLKKDFSHLMQVQICAFAQDPLFSTVYGETNRSIITAALKDYAQSVDVLGTTPYVEQSTEASQQNIEWAITTALEYGLHLDFHLDYNLTPPSVSRPLTYSVLEFLQKCKWTDVANKSKTIVLGHCTQLSVLSDSDFKRLAESIKSSKLPIHFVGLPTSDLFMMGRPDAGVSHSRPRGTLQVLSMIKDLGLSACIGVNNVGNAFTPYGTGDPLQLASWAVGIYQAGTVDDAHILYECVSGRAREAIGLDSDAGSADIFEGKIWRPKLRVQNPPALELPSVAGGPLLSVEARPRLSLKDVVWDPPEVNLRSVVH